MDLETLNKFKESLLNIMNDTILIRDILEAEFLKHNKQEAQSINKLVEDVKKQRKPRKTKNKSVVVETTDLNLEV